MIDTILHTALGLAIALAFWAMGASPLVAAGVGAWSIYLRELTQAQVNPMTGKSDFLAGWDFREWGSQKRLETFVPMAATLIAGTLVGLT